MSENNKEKYEYYTKIAWAIYSLITLIIILILVFFVARDNEERFFYTLMPAAAAYVFRPMNKPFSKLIYKYTGVAYPEEKDDQEKDDKA